MDFERVDGTAFGGAYLKTASRSWLLFLHTKHRFLERKKRSSFNQFSISFLLQVHVFVFRGRGTRGPLRRVKRINLEARRDGPATSAKEQQEEEGGWMVESEFPPLVLTRCSDKSVVSPSYESLFRELSSLV